eukprot:2558309-Amphidinium_carterae.1
MSVKRCVPQLRNVYTADLKPYHCTLARTLMYSELQLYATALGILTGSDLQDIACLPLQNVVRSTWLMVPRRIQPMSAPPPVVEAPD